ncbi:MAG: DUF3310 domain-containing protein [Candidatus Nitrosomaritimum aestuariumsis]
MGTAGNKIEYKFSEDKIIDEIKNYVDSTYQGHYATNKYQATDFIIDGGHGEGFCIGNILKYAQRYGKKDGKSRKDLLKIIHYAMIAMHNHNLEAEKQMEEVADRTRENLQHKIDSAIMTKNSQMILDLINNER